MVIYKAAHYLRTQACSRILITILHIYAHTIVEKENIPVDVEAFCKYIVIHENVFDAHMYCLMTNYNTHIDNILL